MSTDWHSQSLRQTFSATVPLFLAVLRPAYVHILYACWYVST